MRVSLASGLPVGLLTTGASETTVFRRIPLPISFLRASSSRSSIFRCSWLRQQLQDVLEELIRRECKAEITKLKTANSEVPVDLFVHCLASAFFAVLIWWMDRRSRLTPSQIDESFRFLGTPHNARRSRIGRDKALILNFDFLFTPFVETAKQLFLDWRNLEM